MIFFGKFLVIVAIFGAANAQTFSRNECNSKLETVQNFNQSKFVGDWYIILRAYDSLEEGTKCYQVSIKSNDNGGFDMVDSFVVKDKARQALGLGAHLLGDDAGQSRSQINCTANASSENMNRGKLLVVPGLVADAQPMWILDTDYDSYAIVYSCTNAHSGKVEYLWIATRIARPDKAIITKAEELLKAKGIQLALINIDQDCE